MCFIQCLIAEQRCLALRILCLQDDVADSFITMIKIAIKELHIGDQCRLRTDVGPVIDSKSKLKLDNYILRAKEELIIHYQKGYKPALEQGNFVLPTLIEVKSLSQLGSEQFGPISHIYRFKNKKLKKLVVYIN